MMDNNMKREGKRDMTDCSDITDLKYPEKEKQYFNVIYQEIPPTC